MVCSFYGAAHWKAFPCVRLLPLLQLNSRLVGNSEFQSKSFPFCFDRFEIPWFRPNGYLSG